MTASWLDPNVRLFRHKPEPDPHPRVGNLWEVVRVTPTPSSVKSSPQPNRSGSSTVAKFYPNSFVDQGHLHMGNPVWRLVRTPLGYVNNLTVAVGVLIGAAGGAGMAYLGWPIIGVFFLAFMLFGARTQRRAFDYARVYGVWRGLCPNCTEPLNIKSTTRNAKTIACSNCASYVMAKDGVFHIAPWYMQLF